MNDDLTLPGWQPEWAIFRDNVKGLHMGRCITLVQRGRNERYQNEWCDDDDDDDDDD